MFGYINEYEKHITVLSKKYKVIAIATREHGNPELGTRELSYDLLSTLPKGQLAIIPQCGHVDLIDKQWIFGYLILTFLAEERPKITH